MTKQSPRHFKDKLYKQFARVTAAVASPRRLELLELLAQGERTVESLANQAGLSVANTSRHLQILRQAHLVESEKQGLFVVYQLAGEDVFSLLQSIRAIAEQHLAELDRLVQSYFNNRDELEPISREALLNQVEAGTVLVLDVRPVEEYQAGHLPYALSMPLEELEKRLADLPSDKEIVAYCRGPYCVFAYQAIERLRAQGRKARRLVDGFPEWKAAGFPVEVSV
jgi:rhodanese-related sulfurtransferase/predicted transcriptional regulator